MQNTLILTLKAQLEEKDSNYQDRITDLKEEITVLRKQLDIKPTFRRWSFKVHHFLCYRFSEIAPHIYAYIYLNTFNFLNYLSLPRALNLNF